MTQDFLDDCGDADGSGNFAVRFVEANGEGTKPKASEVEYEATIDTSSSSSSASSASSESSMVAGTWCFGHDTDVEQDFTGDFVDGTGDAVVSGSGDAEIIAVAEGNEWITPAVKIAPQDILITYDQYDSGGGTPGTVEYRTGASKTACEAQSWSTYSVAFTSLGWVQVRMSL